MFIEKKYCASVKENDYHDPKFFNTRSDAESYVLKKVIDVIIYNHSPSHYDMSKQDDETILLQIATELKKKYLEDQEKIVWQVIDIIPK